MSETTRPGEAGVYTNFLFDPARAEAQFRAANDLARQVEEQNQRVHRLNEIEGEDFRALAQAGLADTQAETVERLHQAGGIAPYAAVGEKLVTLTRLQADLRQTASTVQEHIASRRAKLEAERKATEEIAGRELPKARLLVEQTMRNVHAAIEQRYPNLEGKITEVNHGLSVVEALFWLASAPWPLPSVRYPSSLPEIEAEETPPATEPELPVPKADLPAPPLYSDSWVDHAVGPVVAPAAVTFVEPAAAAPHQAEATGAAQQQERERDAALVSPSKWLATKLSGSLDVIWTHKTLAEAMMDAGIYEGKDLAYIENRARIIIGSSDQGARFRRLLLKGSIPEGQSEPAIDIQYGSRHMPGVQVRPHRIYRVLARTAANQQLLGKEYKETQSDGRVISWDKGAPLPDLS